MFKKILKWTAIILGGLIAVLLIANALFVWRSSAALESRLQTMRDAGDPVSIAGLARKPIPPENNAATFLRRAQGELLAIDKDLAAFYESEAYKNDRLGPAEIKTLADVLDAHAEAVSLVERAATCPDYDPQLDCSLSQEEFLTAGLDRFGKIRAAARLLRYRTMVHVARGQREDAAQSALALLRLTRHFDNEPMLVGHLVAIAGGGIACDAANRVLRSGPVSDAAREALDAELARDDLTAAFVRTLKSERACGLSAWNDMNFGRFWPARALWNNAVVYYLDVMQQYISTSDSYAAFRQIGPSSVPRPVTPWAMLTDMSLPAIQTARDATERTRATMRCLRVLNAVTRLEQKDIRVTGLGDLKLPDAETADPFTGKPLVMRRLPEGWVIYSLGRNGKDDGGLVADGTDCGLGPVPALPSLQ